MTYTGNNECSTDLSALNHDGQQPSCVSVTEAVPLEERVSTATLQNYRDLLAEISLLPDAILREGYAAKLAKPLGINKSTVMKEMQRLVATEMVDGYASELSTERPMKALFDGLVDLVLNDDGAIKYLIKDGTRLELADSWLDSDGTEYVPPAIKHIKFTLANAQRVIDAYNAEEDFQQLYNDLLVFFQRFSYLEEEVWPIIILAVFLSYIQDHQDVRYIPVIYFFAVKERGKSRTAKSFLAVSYRGLHLADIKPANIVRFSQHLGATIFFDVTDLWKSAEKGDGQDILLGRFEKGSNVVRVLNPEKGPFADQTYFDVYGSTIVATNEPANLTFESRCLTITMPNKPGEYENLSPVMGLPLKERLTAFRAKMMDQRLPSIDPIPGISGRLWDISRPLFQLATSIAPGEFDTMKNVILEMAGQKIEDQKESLEGKIVEAIKSLADFEGGPEDIIPVSKIRELANANIFERYHHTPQKIGKKIKSLSIRTKDLDGRSHACITESQLALLVEQYGLNTATTSSETLQLPTTGDDQGRIYKMIEEVVESGRESLEVPVNNSVKLVWSRPDQQRSEVKPRAKLWNKPS